MMTNGFADFELESRLEMSDVVEADKDFDRDFIEDDMDDSDDNDDSIEPDE